MKKLKLDLAAVKVDSFTVAESGKAEGTVHGQGKAYSIEATNQECCSGAPSCVVTWCAQCPGSNVPGACDSYPGV